jgi:hypothetical protein
VRIIKLKWSKAGAWSQSPFTHFHQPLLGCFPEFRRTAMTAYLLAGHLLNFLAPAALIALMVMALSRLFPRFFISNKAFLFTPWVQTAINFIVGSAVLIIGLVWLSHDGKMLTYVLLVLAMATSQWCQLGSWKR